MAKPRDYRVRATRVVTSSVAALSLFAGTASAEGLSFGVGAAASPAPGGDASAGAAAPPPADGASSTPAPAASPSPQADVPVGEAPAPESKRDRNPANYEFAFVSVAAYQTWSIAGDVLYFGAGGGLGPPLYRYSQVGPHRPPETPDGPRRGRAWGWDSSLEIAYANAFLRVVTRLGRSGAAVDLDVGPKIALGSLLYDTPPADANRVEAPTSYFSMGGYADLRIGSEKIKVGPRFEYSHAAYANYYESGWRITPLMLRVVH